MEIKYGVIFDKNDDLTMVVFLHSKSTLAAVSIAKNEGAFIKFLFEEFDPKFKVRIV